MKREEELKPCPFCGASAHVEQYGDARQSTKYQCDNCGCMLETGEERDFGRDWNRRAPLPTPVGWETEAEWELEMRCCNITEKTPFAEVSKLINDLWQQYCLAAEPKGVDRQVHHSKPVASQNTQIVEDNATEGGAHEKGISDLSPDEYMKVHDAAILAYESNTSASYRYSAVGLRRAVDAAFEARSAIINGRGE
ncbi:Lar family restriction alleviation protein [Rhizobium sp. RHZ02]|uniref:Lar family restriction alleviation protein n=1 Tax=Rhizobium sp. RHZ02 TaxID=2769306 RepID=UPI00177F308E|nr:Lar family restriction alleviation protein [Rhizobium sp. RHZ02]MBD9453273.1 Lar family restriction alleviation protein [Rhizobium sp. RHZ02]